MSVIGGEVLHPGMISLEFRSDFTGFKTLPETEVLSRAASAGDIDLLGHSWLHTMTLAYGVAKDVQLSASAGYYSPSGGATASLSADTGALEETANRPTGPTDLWLQGKWAFYKGPAGRFATFLSVKLPTGKKRVHDARGEAVDFSSTPGSGATDWSAGLGYSTFLTRRATLDASISHVFRGTFEDYRLGDRTDAGVAVAYRLTEDHHAYPQAGVFLELIYRDIGKVSTSTGKDGNSGGRAVFSGPGFRVGFSPRASLTLGALLPLGQSPNGAQIETKSKASMTLSFTF